MAFTASGQSPNVTTAPSPTQPLPEYVPFTTNPFGIIMFPFLSLFHTLALAPYVFPNPVPDIRGGGVAEGRGATTGRRGSLVAQKFVAGHLHSATAASLFATKKEGKHGIVAAAMAT